MSEHNQDCEGCPDCSFVVDYTPIPPDLHEIHITVATFDPKGFDTFCKGQNIKAIVIAYQTQALADMTDVMTSQKFKGTNEDALAEAHRIADLLSEHDFQVTRIKIETTTANTVWMDHAGYYESHLEVFVSVAQEIALREFVATIPELHASRNAFKTVGKVNTIMLTYRDSKTTPIRFEVQVDKHSAALTKAGFKVGRKIVEYCWYDSNLSHDDAWMGAKT